MGTGDGLLQKIGTGRRWKYLWAFLLGGIREEDGREELERGHKEDP